MSSPEFDDIKEVKRTPIKSWFFKGIVIRPICAIIVIAIMLTIIFVGPDKVYNPPPLKTFTIDDLLSTSLQPAKSEIFWNEAGDYMTFLREENETVSVIGVNLTTKETTKITTELYLSQLIGRRIKLDSVAISFDGYYLLVSVDPTSRWDGFTYSSFFIYLIENGTYTWLGDSLGSWAITLANWNPVKLEIAYVYLDDIWLYDVLSMQNTRLTYDGSLPYIIYGRPSWVYRQEIFKNDNCLFWSPNGTHVVYLRTNSSLVNTISVERVVPGEEIPKTSELRYPTAGTPLPLVSLVITDILLNTSVELNCSNTETYITAVSWLSGNEIVYRTMNRSQNIEYLHIYNLVSGTTKSILLREEPNGWIVLSRFYYLGNQKLSFLRNSTGYFHVHVVDLVTNNITQVTSGSFDVTDICGFNPQTNTLFYLSTEIDSRGRDLYGIELSDYSTKWRLTTRTPGYHTASFNNLGTFFVLNYEGPDVPQQKLYEVLDKSTSHVYTVQNNKKFSDTFSSYYTCYPHFTKVLGADSKTFLNVKYLVPPPQVKTKSKFGLLIHAEGNPQSQSSTYQWQFGYDEYLSSTLGIAVAHVDPTGTPGKGTNFLFSSELHLGTPSTKDYITAARNLPYLNEVIVDSNRVAIWGTGIGGYHALRSLLHFDDKANPIKGAIVVDPIIDWSMYQAIFVERVMKLPAYNVEGYNETRILSYLSQYSNAPTFLLIYGTENNDVYMSNSIELKKMMTQGRVAFQTMSYTEWMDDDKIHFYKVMTSYLQQLIA